MSSKAKLLQARELLSSDQPDSKTEAAPPAILLTLCDNEGLLGVFSGPHSALLAAKGHPGPLVAQAWFSRVAPKPGAGGAPAGGGPASARSWVVPAVGYGLPPLFATTDPDEASRVHAAYTQIGAAPECSEPLKSWEVGVDTLTPPAARRLDAHRRDWDPAERAEISARFTALLEKAGGMAPDLDAAPTAIGGSLAELIVERPPAST
jgi:hypothetical protein